jgi:endoglucanase
LAPNAVLYLDGGTPVHGITVAQMADRLTRAGVARTRGFVVNINNFVDDATSRSYADSLVRALADDGAGRRHFLIDSSRNGNGSNGQWCNPAGRALGRRPAWTQASDGLDGYAWFKHPGESDGNCGAGAGSYSGQFVPALAEQLATG